MHSGHSPMFYGALAVCFAITATDFWSRYLCTVISFGLERQIGTSRNNVHAIHPYISRSVT